MKSLLCILGLIASIIIVTYLDWRDSVLWEAESRGEAVLDTLPQVEAWQEATATWYASIGDRWWRRTPALGLRDGTMRRIWQYVRDCGYCLAVPVRDTLKYPLGSWVVLSGDGGLVTARVVDINTDTTYDLIGGLFEGVTGKRLSIGRARIWVMPARKNNKRGQNEHLEHFGLYAGGDLRVCGSGFDSNDTDEGVYRKGECENPSSLR